MAAPKGNKFWMARSSHGRKPIFASGEKLWEACVEYFEWVEANPLWEAQAFGYKGKVTVGRLPKMRAMTISGLCTFLDISQETWSQWRKQENFSEIVTRAETIIRDQKFAGAAAQLLNPNIIARDLGLREHSSSELSGPDGGPIEVAETEATTRAAALLGAARQRRSESDDGSDLV